MSALTILRILHVYTCATYIYTYIINICLYIYTNVYIIYICIQVHIICKYITVAQSTVPRTHTAYDKSRLPQYKLGNRNRQRNKQNQAPAHQYTHAQIQCARHRQLATPQTQMITKLVKQ